MNIEDRYTVKSIFEFDFGCEGLAEGQALMVSVLLTDEHGNECLLQQEDTYLYEQDINEGDVVYLTEGRIKK